MPRSSEYRNPQAHPDARTIITSRRARTARATHMHSRRVLRLGARRAQRRAARWRGGGARRGGRAVRAPRAKCVCAAGACHATAPIAKQQHSNACHRMRGRHMGTRPLKAASGLRRRTRLRALLGVLRAACEPLGSRRDRRGHEDVLLRTDNLSQPSSLSLLACCVFRSRARGPTCSPHALYLMALRLSLHTLS